MNSKYFTYIMTVITIISVISAVYVYTYYQGQIADLNSTISGLQSDITTLQSELAKYRNLTLVDDRGYVLTLTSYPERIVSLAPSNTEILFAVGAGSKVVGVTDYCDYPYNFSAWIEAGNLTSIGGFWNPPVEPIIDLEPDLVLATSASEEAANTLRNMGYNVLILDPKSINGILKDIMLVGRATNNDVEAAILIRAMRERIDNIIKKVAGATSKPKVYCEIWNDPLMSAGPGTWIHELINLAGGINIFENATLQWPIVSSEAVIKQNPDIMIYPHSHGVERFWGSFDDVKARPGWDKISAVQNDRLYEIDADIIARPGPRIVEALEILAQLIHPELF